MEWYKKYGRIWIKILTKAPGWVYIELKEQFATWTLEDKEFLFLS